jgi:ABC-2 type transport system permease protein
VADVTAAERRLPNLSEQLRLVAWLRWHGLRNSVRNKNRRLDILGVILSGVVSGALVVGVAFAMFVGTEYIFEHHEERYFSLMFLALLVWWQLFPIMMAGFAPQFSFPSLLRFPMNFSAFYLVGLAYGFADAAAIAALVWMGAMVVGTLAAHAGALPAMIVACVLFALLNVTMERLFGAWLEKLLAKRRSREVLFTLFILSMISLQFLNPFLQKHSQEVAGVAERALPYFWILPSSFAGNFVARASLGNGTGAIIHLAGLAVYVVLFGVLLRLRYRKMYEGEELSEGVAPSLNIKRATAEPVDDTERLGFLPPQVLVVFRKELRYLRRNTFLFFSLAIPPVMVLFFTMRFEGAHSDVLKKVTPDLFFPGMMAYLILILLAPTYNSFAHEGRGIQTYYSSPVNFREILLAKNLVTVIIVLIEIGICMGLVGLRVGWPSVPVLLATMMAVVFSVTGQLTIANWSSLSFPKKMDFGKMQGQRNSGMSVLTLFGVQIVLSGIGALILWSGRLMGSPWLPAQVFAVLAIAAMAGYFSALDALSELAEKKKEVLMEALCR